LPLFRYSPQISANRPKATIRCHSVTVVFSPEDRLTRFSLVAIRKFATVVPLLRYFTSGSAPRLPMRMTLFTPAIESSYPCQKRQKRLSLHIAWTPPCESAVFLPTAMGGSNNYQFVTPAHAGVQ